jgi:hypothetical protein
LADLVINMGLLKLPYEAAWLFIQAVYSFSGKLTWSSFPAAGVAVN